MSRLKITLRSSPIGHNETQKRTVRALGLRRLHQTVYQPDNPSIRGMIARIPHLLEVEVVQEPANQPSNGHDPQPTATLVINLPKKQPETPEPVSSMETSAAQDTSGSAEQGVQASEQRGDLTRASRRSKQKQSESITAEEEVSP